MSKRKEASLERLRCELKDPAQAEFLRLLSESELVDHASVQDLMKASGIGAGRLIRWLDDPLFRELWFLQSVMLEAYELPWMLRLMRRRAEGDARGGASWAKLWMDSVGALRDTAMRRIGELAPASSEDEAEDTALEAIGIRVEDAA